MSDEPLWSDTAIEKELDERAYLDKNTFWISQNDAREILEAMRADYEAELAKCQQVATALAVLTEPPTLEPVADGLHNCAEFPGDALTICGKMLICIEQHDNRTISAAVILPKGWQLK